MRRSKTSKPPSQGYIAYYRVSTARQGESGLGLEAQRVAVAQFAHETPILAEYTEIESGKTHKNRPQLLAALDEAKKRHATLLIAKLDRLARNVHFISGLRESKTRFVACDMPDANWLTIHIMASMAEHERDMISARTKAALASANREIAANGFRVSRKTGKRYSKHGNPRWRESIARAREAKHPPAAPSCLAIMRDRAAAGDSLRAIAAHVNALGLRTPAGAAWYASTVRKALVA